VKFNMIKVDGGTFKMGATKEQRDAHKSEKPVHPVTVSDYYIAETEVTQELWRTIVHESPFEFYGDKLPAEHLKRDRILKFLQRLTNITGWQFRLPTEAEWEFAARGGNKSKGYMYSGSNNPDEVMWYFGNAESENQEVAKKKPNELGLYDMSGNVQEWCSDYYGPYQKSKEPVVDPKGPESGEKYVLRGGSCDTKPWYSRVSMRNDGKMAGGNSICGVRMVMVPKK
jgi:formylglycine-generating enzyme required for sulfatase activity